jgi:hypothetical protein
MPDWMFACHADRNSACRTQGGIFTTPGEAYTTPVEMWLKGLGKLDFPFYVVYLLLHSQWNQIFWTSRDISPNLETF